MAITFVGSSSATQSSAAANYDITLPATLQNDLVIVAYGLSNPADADLLVNTAGYTELADLYSNDIQDTNLAVAYKFMDAVPDTVCNVSGTSSVNRAAVGIAYVFRGVSLSSPIDVAIQTATGIDNYVPDPPSITPITSGAFLVAIGAGSGITADATGSAPAGYTNLIANSIAGGVDALFIAVASKLWAGGADNPSTFTGYDMNIATPTASSWAAATLALRPSSVAVGGKKSLGLLGVG